MNDDRDALRIRIVLLAPLLGNPQLAVVLLVDRARLLVFALDYECKVSVAEP